MSMQVKVVEGNELEVNMLPGYFQLMCARLEVRGLW